MTGVLLINLGTPDDPTPVAVGRYLREFLMDPLVIDLPAPLRWFLVNVTIVPRRKHRSAEAYKKIQMAEGSPLLVYTRALAEKVAAELGAAYDVEYGMRYGNPSIGLALKNLQARGVSRIVVVPLYPQYAESSYETAVVETKRRAREIDCEDLLTFVPPFYNDAGFIDAWANHLRSNIDPNATDHVVFSFHGVPVRHLTKFHRDPNYAPSAECCTEITSTNENCYRAQCFVTAHAIAKQLELHAGDYTVSFQSRLGRAEWIGPNTVDVFRDLAARGHQRIAVACPSFICDCLETLEEIGIRGRETFLATGGQAVQLIPSLNADGKWVESLANLIRETGNNERAKEITVQTETNLISHQHSPRLS
ncbi:MAG TPA: ferrochelatase [Pyrinomonadaceae bacterium]|jgi:ferrochelatase|nr:ferrochelatase [Pyrinomonadaceae bacterium]